MENAPKLNLKDYVKNFWFLGMLLLIFVVTFSFSIEGDWVKDAKKTIKYIIALNMLLMSFSLKPEMILKGALNIRGQATAFLVSYAVLPALAFGVGLIFYSGDSFVDRGLFVGMLVAAAVPTTLVSAAIWARLSGGNDAFSMVFTLISNGSGVVLTPLIIAFMLSSQVDSCNLPVGEMVIKLVLIVILPVTVGQVIRIFAGQWPTKLKPLTSKLCQLMVLSVVFFSVAGVKCRICDTSGGTVGLFLTLALAVLIVHVAAFFVCYFMGHIIRMKREDRIALTFSGSQKTLQVGIYVATYITMLPAFEELCFITFPMIFMHAVQLAVDVVFIELYKRKLL